MILSGCFGLGMWYREQFFGRVRALRIMREMLDLLAGEVRYGRSSLPECCLRVASFLEPPFSVAFRRVANRMEENIGNTFGEVFRSELEPVLCRLPIKPEDKEIFLKIAVQTGFADGQMQLHILEQSSDMLRQKECVLEKENAEKCRMAVGLGAMSGLLLLLVLW